MRNLVGDGLESRIAAENEAGWFDEADGWKAKERFWGDDLFTEYSSNIQAKTKMENKAIFKLEA